MGTALLQLPRLERRDLREVSCFEYLQRFSRVSSAALDMPLGDHACAEYRCSAEELIAVPTFPVWFTDRERTVFVDYNAADACPISFAELATIDPLREEKLRAWSQHRPADADSRPVELLVEHCRGCDRRVVKDGCHRLLWIAHQGAEGELTVTEISGADWSRAQFDMRTVCRCAHRR